MISTAEAENTKIATKCTKVTTIERKGKNGDLNLETALERRKWINAKLATR